MAVRASSIGSDTGALVRVVVPLLLVIAVAVLTARGLTSMRLDYAFSIAAAGAVFLIVFLKTELALYLVIVSMLLSPEFSSGGVLAERREVVLRTEDFLLLVIAVSWIAKTAVNKELGLVLKTPMNRPIFAYVGAHAIATTYGALAGWVGGPSGLFFVLKYVEYFVVYYMVVNNVTTRAQARRLVVVALVTAAVVSLVGIAQIPSGARVSAPFEGDTPEPNTLGGYLLLLMAIALGIALETRRLGTRVAMFGLTALMSAPFLFTLSRASYLGAVPMVLVVAWLSRHRRTLAVLLALAVVASPVAYTLVPDSVTRRVAYTFEPEAGQPTVKVGRLGLDPSTSARFISMQQALEGFARRPLLGYGVTGFGFIDSQYARTLVETGVVGFATLLALVAAAFRTGVRAVGAACRPEDRGLAIGFVAATVGLCVHAIGSNTFIIVRIMEPYWLFAGIVTLLPSLAAAEDAPAPPPRRAAWPVHA
jgi:hypothetical protein